MSKGMLETDEWYGEFWYPCSCESRGNETCTCPEEVPDELNKRYEIAKDEFLTALYEIEKYLRG